MKFRIGDKITVTRGREQGHTGVIIDIDNRCVPPIVAEMSNPYFHRMFFFNDEIELREEW